MDIDLTKLSAKSREELRQEDIDLWKKWKSGGQKPDDLRPLLNNFRGLIRSQANSWANNVELPPAAIHSEFKRWAVDAFKTYDPDKGAGLGTWVGNRLKKARRWISTYQNTARIGEHRIYKIGQYNAAKATLDDMYGREPTTDEMSEYLGWSPKEVGRMETEKRSAFIESAFEGDPTSLMPSMEAERLRLVKYELTPEQQLVYEYTLGDGGKPQLKPGEIARQLNMSPAKVTRIRSKIYDKIKEFS